MKILEKKVCLIIGGSMGIGKAIAIDFAKRGAIVFIASRNIDKNLEVCREIKKYCNEAYALQLDVLKEENIKQVINDIYLKYGRIDVAVNNAGVSSMKYAIDLTEEDWDFNMDVNAKGVFLCCKHEAKKMLEQQYGKIINTASMAAKRGIPLLSHYAASKYAVVGFSKSLALELAPHNITVNCICPGLVKTEMQEREIQWEAELRKLNYEEIKQGYINMTPLGRLETPEDVAKVVSFLAGPDSDFMTGQAINITGGIETN